MKTTHILLITYCLMLPSLLQAQPPWRAKLFMHFLDSNNQIATDTVWFGCDSLGAEGYQPGLDSVVTNLQWNKVYSTDDLVKAQFGTDCANLKRNIIGFKKQKSSFRFYAFGKPISMSWDTMDFRYFDPSYWLSYVEIKPANGYINNIDQQYYEVAGDNYFIINGQYIFRGFWVHPVDSIRLFPESLHSGCSFSNYVFEFYINIIMGPRFVIGVDELLREGKLSIYPNPFIDKLFIRQNKGIEFSEISLYDMQGGQVLKSNINVDITIFDTDRLPAGIYYMTFKENNIEIYKPIKLIKL
jgi:hypothetical protein